MGTDFTERGLLYLILATEGQGSEARLQIKFRAVGTKWMVAQFVQANGKENPFAEL